MQLRTTIFEPVQQSIPVKVDLHMSEASASQPTLFQQLKCLIIVPAFNESKSVPKLVRRLNRALPDCHVLVIDDGSTDATAREIPSTATAVSLPFNLGIGGAMQTGYRYAASHGYDVAIQVDGDGQHRPCEVEKLVRKLVEGPADLVVGSRFLSEPGMKPSFTRMTGIHVLSSWIRILCGLKVTDCTSGFRAANRKVILAFAHWYPEDYPEPEVVLLLHRSKFKVVEVAVRMRRRMYGKSSISLLRGLYYVLKVSVCLFLDMIRQPWPSGKLELP